jgi:homopolymeric O-antigen transport system permease protein
LSSVVEPRPSGESVLELPDTSLIPPEPPQELLYNHRVRLVPSLRNLWDHREIVYTLAERDFRAQYKQATLGVMWAILSPLATLIIFVIIFSRVTKIPSHGIPYALFAFTGILCWTFFSSTLGQGGNSLLVNKALLEKTQFPRECFPLEVMGVNGVNTVLSWIPLAILFAINARAPHLEALWSPVFMVIEVAFAAGVALGISGLIIQMRDLAQVLPVITSLGLFATPVVWPFSYLHGWQQQIYSFFNPLGPVIDNARRTMLAGNAPKWDTLIIGAIGALFYLAVGYRLFKRFEVNFADIA